MDFEAWKKKAAHEANRLAGLSDLLGEDDPYGIEDDMLDAFEEELTPEEFIREAFEDDIANYEDDGDEEDDDDDEDDLDELDDDEEEDEDDD